MIDYTTLCAKREQEKLFDQTNIRTKFPAGNRNNTPERIAAYRLAYIVIALVVCYNSINGNGIFLPGVISLSFPGHSGETILHRMDLMNIAISTGSACNSVSTEISHVLKAIKLDEITAKGTIRISLGKDNTVEDVHDIVSALTRILK